MALTHLNAESARVWNRVSRLIAVVGVAVIAARIPVVDLLTLGDVGALALAPVWLSSARRFSWAGPLLCTGLLCVPVGLLLTLRSAVDHELSWGLFEGASTWMVGLVASVGFLLWAREQLGASLLALVFGLGMVLGIDPSTNLFSTNPWKFGFAVPITVLALALAHRAGRRWIELALLVTLAAVCFMTDSRSALGILLLACAFMAWQLRSGAQHRTGSPSGALLGSALAVVAVYHIGQALVLGGAFGEVTQARSEAQVERAGSLIVGGRPELLASISMIAADPWGPGAGARPSYGEIMLAKGAMATIDYDPDNGYVEDFMFGSGYSLHSVFGDLWAQWGLMGLVFTGAVVLVVMRRLTAGLADGGMPAITLYLSCALLWNVFFAPWYSSIRLLELLLAMILVPRPDADPLQ